VLRYVSKKEKEMKTVSRVLSARVLTMLALAAALALSSAVACKKAPPKQTAEATPPPPTPTEVPPPPAPAPTPAPRGDDVMSADIAALNARGYLKDGYFDYNEATLRDDTRSNLAADAEWLKKYSTIQILVEGHCDERGTTEYNLALGDRRANAVKEYLGSLGVDASRVRTVSYGKERPFCTESNEQCWQSNRRGHLLITAK
jgi:peptidoglycan-associated lipoprotein